MTIPPLSMMKPEPSEVTRRLGASPERCRSKKSLKNSSKGEPGGNCGAGTAPLPALTFCVVEMLTTAGDSWSTRSAKEVRGAPRRRRVGESEEPQQGNSGHREQTGTQWPLPSCSAQRTAVDVTSKNPHALLHRSTNPSTVRLAGQRLSYAIVTSETTVSRPQELTSAMLAKVGPAAISPGSPMPAQIRALQGPVRPSATTPTVGQGPRP